MTTNKGKQSYKGLQVNMLKEWRKIKGWTQEKCFTLCRCSVSAWSRYENNKAAAPDYVIEIMAEAWGLKNSDLVKIKDKKI